MPKILIVTEKLLTGFDAPILYAMYLDKPMRDHTLLQAIARVNRPYENEAAGDGQAARLRARFRRHLRQARKGPGLRQRRDQRHRQGPRAAEGALQEKMSTEGSRYLALVDPGFNDKDVDTLIEHFRDKDRRKEFFKEYKEIEMLYEIISPDAFLRPFIDRHTLACPRSTPSSGTPMRRRSTWIGRFKERRTSWCRSTSARAKSSRSATSSRSTPNTIALIKTEESGDGTKVINLIKSIEKTAEEESGDPFLIALADRAKAVQESFEDRQDQRGRRPGGVVPGNREERAAKEGQAEKGFDGLTFFVYRTLLEAGVGDAEAASGQIEKAFGEHPNWRSSDAELRELRNDVTFAVYAQMDDEDEVAKVVDDFFILLAKAYKTT